MTDDSTPRPADPDRPPATRLDRAPGERYRGMGTGTTPDAPTSPAGGASQPASAAAGSTTRAVLAGAVMAVVGALLYAVLGQIDLGPGLLAVAAFLGWTVGVAIVWGAGAVRPVPHQRLLAGLLGCGAIIVGLVLAAAWARLDGGVLGPLEYTNERYGPIAYVEVLVAGAVAALRAR